MAALYFGNPNRVFNANEHAADLALGYQADADASMEDSVSAAQDGVNAATGGVDAARVASGQVNNSIQNINRQANSLLPYASTLRGYADTMWDQGTNIVGTGNSILNTGTDILNLNTGASGIAGEYVNWLNSVDPNKYVSGAASDVQSSYGNVTGQMDRNLARSGVSSGQSLSVKQQFHQGLMAALAGAKTRARQQGLADKGKALTGAMDAARGMFETGGNIVRTGVESQTAAGSSQTSAANIEVQAGQLHGQAGQLAIGNADLMIKAYGSSTAANNALSLARAKAAEYYASVGEGYAQLTGGAAALFHQARKDWEDNNPERKNTSSVRILWRGDSRNHVGIIR